MEVAVLSTVFKDRVREELSERGWSIRELSRRIGQTPGYMGRYLNSDVDPGLDVIERVANAFSVSAIDLLTQKENLRRVG